jgi:SAM-dependent methyltransferase
MPKKHREMNKKYWDGMAGAYEDEILSVLHSDTCGLIKARLKKISSKKASVADVGCGIGHFLPLLSESFGKVYANDLSAELLGRAEETCGHLKNITFLAGDISSVFKKIPRVDCVVSVNALISSSMAIREKIFQAISDRLKPQGYLVLVVPSWESMLLVDVRYLQWKRAFGFLPEKALKSVYPSDPLTDNKARQGVFAIDGVATKHYLKEELEALLSSYKLDTLEFVKIEYSWDSELDCPPAWMQAPYPWDWLVVARRRK